MRILVKGLLKFVVVLSLIYCSFFSFFLLKDNEIGLVYDKFSGKAVYYFSSKYNFVWHGLQPWQYKIEKISNKRSLNLNLTTALPGIRPLENEIYYVKVPVQIEFELDKSNLPDVIDFSESGETYLYIKSVLQGTIDESFSKYIGKNYNRSELIQKKGVIVKEFPGLISEKFTNSQYKLNKVEISGVIYFPEMEIYREGIAYSKELRTMLIEKKKIFLKLESDLQKEKTKNSNYFEKLKKISELIKENPDILKYIYIDKMAPNIKVIISSDKTGLPSLFDSEKAGNSDKNGDIDNLR